MMESICVSDLAAMERLSPDLTSTRLTVEMFCCILVKYNGEQIFSKFIQMLHMSTF